MSETILIVNATPDPLEQEALAYYSENASAILKAHKGRLVGKYKAQRSITAEAFQKNLMIMEFDDDGIIEALTSSEQYQRLIPYRDKAFTQISISFADKVV